ncbi:MAG: hypothetical protein GF411_01800 [Candidatus Lokiarchaeota archaeon]|nr:hypothetical protein [Candidatus Woesearchaeota archaeon]MBD3404852.1 hypothetical protein [Candidatus Lokiarchaeota archaeon]
MKKVIFLISVFVLLTISVVAPAPENDQDCQNLGYDGYWTGQGGIDAECIKAGYDFGVAKWEYNEIDKIFEKESEISGFSTYVNGSDSYAGWTSNPGISGVISKEGKCYQILSGGTTGSIEKLYFGISHVTLCKDTEEDIPEFNGFSAVFLSVAALVFVVFRKSK